MDEIGNIVNHHARQVAFQALRAIQKGSFADVILDRSLAEAKLAPRDRGLVTELVYGTVRRQRTLDALITQLGRKPHQRQPAELRLILQLGLYQLRYLSQIPGSAAVNTTVELAKQNRFAGLTGFVNGLLRQYLRLQEQGEVLQLPADPIARLGILHSHPDWIVQVFAEQLPLDEVESLCEWLNQPPPIDLRVNVLKRSVPEVEAAFQAAGIIAKPHPYLPQALRLVEHAGAIQSLPGFEAGWWMVQDSSAQLVSHLLNPQPGETVIDACAAPGGKTLHLAELMQDQGQIWACDRSANRLKKLQANTQRLGISSIQTCAGDSRNLSHFVRQGDRVLLDAPCSGLGTLHRHADARWRQTPESIIELATLQQELLEQVSTWVKPGGILVYSTCTLHPLENETVIQSFLERHPNWILEPLPSDSPLTHYQTSEGWLKVWPHSQQMDGFFMARLRLK